MTLLICGTGSIARRHLANLRQLQPDARLVIVRLSDRALTSPLDDDVQVMTSLEAALALSPRAAVVAGPSTTHVATAMPIVAARVPVLIEKPLAASLDGVETLIAAAAALRVPVMVGYQLRFHAAIRRLRELLEVGAIGRLLFLRAEVGQHLADWRPGADQRKCVSAQHALGGGALLELSHEIDYARWIAGDAVQVRADVDRLGDVTVDVEDWVALSWRTGEGVVVDLRMDMLQRPAVRTCRLVGTEGTLAIDVIAGGLTLLRPGAAPEILLPAGQIDRNAPYLEELRVLLSLADGGTDNPIPLDDGRRVLQIVEAARLSAASHGQAVWL